MFNRDVNIKKRIITSDSTCDLGDKLIKENNIKIFPIKVILGDKTYTDGIDIAPQDIFDYTKKTGKLPKTTASNAYEYTEFFEEILKECDEIIHISLSSGASSIHSFANEASKNFDGKVKVIDSKALSTGQGLLVLKAVELTKEGYTLDESADLLDKIKLSINTSFVLDSLEYLHKGGRCSLLSMLGAKLLAIHPYIDMVDGSLKAKKKYIGDMKKCTKNYLSDLIRLYPEYDKQICFITHSNCDQEIIDEVRNGVLERFNFETIHETVAGSVITSHCGKGTIGVLFYKISAQ